MGRRRGARMVDNRGKTKEQTAMARTSLVFLPWRTMAWRAVDSGKAGTRSAMRRLCIFASPVAADGGETFTDGGRFRRAAFIHIFFNTNPMPDGLATRCPWQFLLSFAGA